MPSVDPQISLSPRPMRVYAAPLQGYTDAVWRQAHAALFGGVEKYFSPFLRVEHGQVRRHNINDVAPEHNQGVNLVPQLLASPPEQAELMSRSLLQLGYRHIDINLGCPFPPVALKRKGSGMLPHPHLLEDMFRALAKVEGVTYSVKMRLGWQSAQEWRQVLPLLHIVAPCHLTVHPRLGIQQYKGELLLDEFEQLLQQSSWPVVYNGEITSIEEARSILDHHPTLHAVMIGRGLVADPAMLTPEKAQTEHYRHFHQALLEGYTKQLTGGKHQLLQRMQSLWQLFLPKAPARALKSIKKARTLEQYLQAVEMVWCEI